MKRILLWLTLLVGISPALAVTPASQVGFNLTWNISAVDNFNRANGAFTTPWIGITGEGTNFVVSGNKAISSTLVAGSDYYYNQTGWNSNQFAWSVLGTPSSTPGAVGYGMVTNASSSATTFYGFTCNGGGWQIKKVVAGTITNLSSSTAPACVNGDIVLLSLNNGTLTFYRNWVSVASVADSAITGGAPGIRFVSTDGAGGSELEWGAGNITFNTTTLLNYLQSLKTSGTAISGQHGDYYSGSTLATAYDQMGGTTAATLNIHADSGDGGGATGQVTGIIGVSMGTGTPGVLGSSSPAVTSAVGGSGIHMNGLAVAQDWKSTIPAGIVALSSWFINPNTGDLTGATSAQAAQILTTGSSSQITFFTYVDNLASFIKQIPGTVLYRPFVENNLTGETYGPNIGSANQIALFQLIHDRMVITDGVTNVLWTYNINDSFGGSPPTSSFLSSYPGSSYVDVVSWDSYTATPGTNAASTGVYTQLLTLGKPIVIFEAGAGSSNTAGIYNNYTYFTDLRSHCPQVVAVVYWTQNWAISLQGGANNLLNVAPVINRGGLPPISWLRPAANDSVFDQRMSAHG